MAAKRPQNQKNQKVHQPSHRLRKWLPGILAGLALLALVILIWFRLSPWPGAMLIRYVFEQGGKKVTKELNERAPDGIAVIADQPYQKGNKDTVLDAYYPKDVQPGEKLPVVIWTHGGAWLSGDKADSAGYFKQLAKEGYAVIAPNYSLAPDHQYPTPVHQLNAMYAYVQQNADRFHADTSRIVLAGDSAGSQLSAQMAAIITNPAYASEVGVTPNLKPEQLKGTVLTCGIYKMDELAHPSDVPRIIGWGDDVTVWAYSGTHDFSDPVIRQMSPHYHVTKHFPPTFITGGNDDPLTNVQSKPFADELEHLGVNVTRLFYPKDHKPALPHEYQFNLDTADGKKAFDQIVDFLQKNT